MDTDLLKTFLEVCKTRHFGKAAENLYVTQAAVSSRIRQLEDRLSTELFSRLRNNLQLTPAGERLLPHAESVLTAWQRAFQEVAINDQLTTFLALGGSPNVWDLTLQRALIQLKRSKPELALRAEVLSQSVVARQLLERHLDLALVFDAPKVDEICTVELFDVPLELVSSSANISIDNINDIGYIMLDWGTVFSMQHAKLCKALPAPTLHTNLARVALEYILEEGGAAYLPANLTLPYIKQKRLFTVENAPKLHREIYACFHKDNDKKDLLEDVIERLKQTGSQVAASLLPE